MFGRTSLIALIVVLPAALARGDGPDAKSSTRLKLAIDLPKDPATPTAVSQGEYAIKLVFTNNGKQDLVLWPYASLEIKDALNQTVPTKLRQGRWGRSNGTSILEQITFVILKPNLTHALDINLNRYLGDADSIKGWELKPGNYTLVVTYEYDPAEAKKKFGKGARDLDNPTKMWNRAYHVKEKVEAKLRVRAK